MTTMDLNTYKLELIRNISAAGSFEEVKRAFRNVSLQAARRLKQTSAEEKEADAGKDEIVKDIRQGVKEMKAIKAGKMKAISWEEMIDEL